MTDAERCEFLLAELKKWKEIAAAWKEMALSVNARRRADAEAARTRGERDIERMRED